MQPGSDGDEDCLYLNVYAPPKGVTPEAVMVWIHGGCYVYGSGNDYSGEDQVERGDVIVVSVNFRIGIFGFMGAD